MRKITFALPIVILVISLQKVSLHENQKRGCELINADLTSFSEIPSQYISGTIHYFRVHPTDWRDRLYKLKWAGFNAVQTYVEWSSHEPEPGKYVFDEGLDLINFIKIAEEEGLFVIIRPGPYICSERDMGGLPYWLLSKDKNIKLRSSDTTYMKYVKRWFNVLLPMLKPLMHHEGGPIKMVQVENEYGNCENCDFEYLTELKSILLENLGLGTFLFGTDNALTNSIRCSKIPGVYQTIDFGPGANVNDSFRIQRLFEPIGPLINSEYYSSIGWFDFWGYPYVSGEIQPMIETFRTMLKKGASVNIYVFHGGTNFGFGSGSLLSDYEFKSTPTTYDYDAPLNEAGDLTEKYFAIRNLVKEFFPVAPMPEPPKSPKYGYGKVDMFPMSSLFDMIKILPSERSKYPQTFEELGVRNGIVAYQYILNNSITDPAILWLNELHDRGYVYVDEEFQGILSRQQQMYELPIYGKPNQTITIFVESQGRISVGPALKDFKGLTTVPQLNWNKLKGWKMIPIVTPDVQYILNALEKVKIPQISKKSLRNDGGMTFYKGNFQIDDHEFHPKDTFLQLKDWSKGYVWINNFMLGRYWPVMGPQLNLYVPHGVLKQGRNFVLILELEKVEEKVNPEINFVSYPQINGPTPNS